MSQKKFFRSTLLEFNYLRAIGICLVVIGHSFPSIDKVNNITYKYIHSIIYSFHMPLFMIISGFFAQKIMSIKSIKEYKIFIYSKFRRLMIPYITISFLTIPIKLVLNKFSERPLVISEILKDIFMYPWNNPIIFFWFIYVLFVIFIFSPIIVNLNKLLVLITFVILHIIPKPDIQFMAITSTINYSIFFFIGLYLNSFYMKNRNTILNINIKPSKYILFIIIPVLIFLFNIHLPKDYKNIVVVILFNIFYLLKSLLGVYVCFIASLLIYKLKSIRFIPNLLNLISEYSFDIYLLSWSPQIFCRIVFYQILNLNYGLVITISLISGFSPIVMSKFIFRKYDIFKKFILGIS